MAKIDANIDGLNDLIKSLKVKHRVRVGIFGSKAHAQHDSKSGLTNGQLGEIHEFGATINHPGGQPYYFDQKTNKAVFLPKDIPFSENLPHTKPHTINIPARSFLYQPLVEKLSSDPTGWKKEAWKAFFIKNKPYEFFKFLGTMALQIVEGAFETGGYGQWKPLTAGTLRKPRGTNLPLMDTRGLRGSIQMKVYKR